MMVQVSPLSEKFFSYYFLGKAYSSDLAGLNPDYEVVYIRDSQIGLVPKNGRFNGTLEHVISLNGIEHVWIHRLTEPESIQEEVDKY